MLSGRCLSRRSIKSFLEDSTRKSTCAQSRKLWIGGGRTVRLNKSFSSQRQHAAEIKLKKELIRNHIYTLQSSRRKFSTSCALSHGHIDPPKPGEEYVRKRGLQPLGT